ncbi:ribonuclease domain-containing protein [Nocardia vermiculata]|uniref:Ribonuclease n=1 Tax=Nocardia vermiculata TaxID=257274 RepID=A0A846XXT0_9NOCA|nr:ribonuclease domain-containing protein [Nocardia vermiculata]NKY50504.1 ribonuclease [Nocardia vermiculata]
MSDKRIRTLLVLGGLVVAAIVAGLLGLRGGETDSGAQSVASTQSSVAAAATSAQASSASAAQTPGSNVRKTPAATRAPGVPDHAYDTLAEIDAGRWPDSADAPGTKGGDRWGNREGNLPKTDDNGKSVKYQEWDVNPKQRGQGRDAERIVTSSDGKAYYTADHYRTFTRMR